MATKTSESGLSRRNFARTVLGGGVAAALACSARALPMNLQAGQPTLVPPQEPLAQETEAAVAQVLAQYGSRLDAAQRARLPEIVRGHTAMLAPIRALAQPNSAPPATVLRLVTRTGESQ